MEQISDDICYTALLARDNRFDGRFYTAVKTTGIFCRPICPAVTPKRQNVTFFPSAEAAIAHDRTLDLIPERMDKTKVMSERLRLDWEAQDKAHKANAAAKK